MAVARSSNKKQQSNRINTTMAIKKEIIEEINQICNKEGFEGSIRESNFIYDYTGYFEDKNNGIKIIVHYGYYPNNKKEGNYEVNINVPAWEHELKIAKDISKRILESCDIADKIKKILSQIDIQQDKTESDTSSENHRDTSRRDGSKPNNGKENSACISVRDKTVGRKKTELKNCGDASQGESSSTFADSSSSSDSVPNHTQPEDINSQEGAESQPSAVQVETSGREKETDVFENICEKCERGYNCEMILHYNSCTQFIPKNKEILA